MIYKNIFFLIILSILTLSLAEAADLSDFPQSFMKGDKFNGYIIVGKDGTSTDVIGQSMIASKISLYAGSPQFDINKLDDEATLDNNLILIGNPCVNKLTAELLDNPEECDRDFPEGKAYLKYIEKNDRRFIIAAGATSKANKQAAEYLANYDRNRLEGDEIELSVDEQATKKKETKDSSASLPPGNIVAPPPEADEVYKNEKEMNQEIKYEEKEKIGEKAGEAEAGHNSNEKVPTIVIEDKGFFTKVMDWFKGLFKKKQ